MIRKIILILTLFVGILSGCNITRNENFVDVEINDNEGDEEMNGMNDSSVPMMISYGKIFLSDSGKTLKDENLDELSVLVYARFDERADYYIFDFEKELFFNTDFGQTVNSELSLRPADAEVKKTVISELQNLKAEDWWGKTYDVESEEIQSWFNSTDYSHVWRLYMQFENGEVITLYGIGYDEVKYAPEELNEFLKYLRSFVGE